MKLTPALVTLLLDVLHSDVVAQEDQHAEIQQALARLEPMTGNWSTIWRFHRGDEIIERVGTDSISVILNQTYQEWRIERHPRGDSGRSQTSLIFTTFDPRSHQYIMTHFYQGSSLRVTAEGRYDESSHTLTTKAFIFLEDGLRDENVRAIIDISDRDRMVYTHYSRFNDESKEQNRP